VTYFAARSSLRSTGPIDYETEVAIKQSAMFKSTVYLGDGMKMVVRVRTRGINDFIRFTFTEHGTMLERDLAILDSPGRLFDVSLKRATAKRDYVGKKKSYFLV
jgi:hypothetical protein